MIPLLLEAWVPGSERIVTSNKRIGLRSADFSPQHPASTYPAAFHLPVSQIQGANMFAACNE